MRKVAIMTSKKSGTEFIKQLINPISVRKSKPEGYDLPMQAAIYETKADGGAGRIIALATLTHISHLPKGFNASDAYNYKFDMTEEQFERYSKKGSIDMYFWHLKDIVEVDHVTEKERDYYNNMFRNSDKPLIVTRDFVPPMSWCLDDLTEDELLFNAKA